MDRHRAMGRVTYWVMSTAYAIEEQCYKRAPDEQEGGMDEYFFEERGGVFLLLIILYKLKERTKCYSLRKIVHETKKKTQRKSK